jgi:hypothetical protein
VEHLVVACKPVCAREGSRTVAAAEGLDASVDVRVRQKLVSPGEVLRAQVAGKPTPATLACLGIQLSATDLAQRCAQSGRW